MKMRVHVLRSDGSELHVPHLADLFDLAADGIVSREDVAFSDFLEPTRLDSMPELKWAFVAADHAASAGPYASYELREDAVADEGDLDTFLRHARPGGLADGAPLLH